MVLNGTDYIIFIDTVTPITGLPGDLSIYRPVVCGKSNGFNGDVESISVRNKCDDGWDNTLAGYGTWSMSMDGQAISMRNSEKLLKANFEEISTLFINKTHFWAMMADTDGSVVRRGVVRISSYAETANMDEPYAFNISLTGIGKPYLNTNITPIPEIGNIYYGITNEIPTTQASIKALNIQDKTDNNWQFETGLNRGFTIALPPGYTLISVLDLTSEEDITLAFDTVSIITVDGQNYTVKTMQNAINFLSSHTFEMTTNG